MCNYDKIILTLFTVFMLSIMLMLSIEIFFEISIYLETMQECKDNNIMLINCK